MLIFCKKLLFGFGKNKTKTIANVLPTLIVADEKNYDSVIELLKNAGAKLQIIGRVHPDNYSPKESVGKLEELPHTNKSLCY